MRYASRGVLRMWRLRVSVREYRLGMSSVVKKRRKAITKHKLKKRRHRERFKAKH
jgi:hypothetical protein